MLEFGCLLSGVNLLQVLYQTSRKVISLSLRSCTHQTKGTTGGVVALHRQTVEQGNTDTSAVAEHAWKKHHRVD